MKIQRHCKPQINSRVTKKEKKLSREEGIEVGEERGKAVATRNLIQRIGGKRFGPINAPIEERLNAITSLEELEQLADRLLEIESWTELFQP